jgi:hypothetical protein
MAQNICLADTDEGISQRKRVHIVQCMNTWSAQIFREGAVSLNHGLRLHHCGDTICSKERVGCILGPLSTDSTWCKCQDFFKTASAQMS